MWGPVKKNTLYMVYRIYGLPNFTLQNDSNFLLTTYVYKIKKVFQLLKKGLFRMMTSTVSASCG